MKKFILTTTVILFILGGYKKAAACKPGEYVEIEGVKWACTNLGTPFDPSEFYYNREGCYNYYLWNSKSGLNIAGRHFGVWRLREQQSYFWQTANDPCPLGWRLPDAEEFEALAPHCTWFELDNGPGLACGKHIRPDNKRSIDLFFPACGHWHAEKHYNGGHCATYWCHGANGVGGHTFLQAYQSSLGYGTIKDGEALPIRCVKK
jgi:uncharacterized protein (TIGR02145 family)